MVCRSHRLQASSHLHFLVHARLSRSNHDGIRWAKKYRSCWSCWPGRLRSECGWRFRGGRLGYSWCVAILPVDFIQAGYLSIEWARNHSRFSNTSKIKRIPSASRSGLWSFYFDHLLLGMHSPISSSIGLILLNVRKLVLPHWQL